MKTRRMIWLTAVLLVLVAVGREARGAVASTRTREAYQGIVERNPFALKPPPPPTPPPEAPPEPPKPKTEIMLTGIVRQKNGKSPKVYLMTKEPAGPGNKQGQPKNNYYALLADQEQDGIRILSIDDKLQSVRVRNGGNEINLTFKENGLKLPSGPPPGAPGLPGQPGAPMVPGQMVPGAVPPPGAPGVNNFQPAAGAGGVQNQAVPPVNRTLPSRALRTQEFNGNSANAAQNQAGAGGSAAHAPEPEIDPARQYINLKLQEAAARRQGQDFPPIPDLHSSGGPPIPGQ